MAFVAALNNVSAQRLRRNRSIARFENGVFVYLAVDLYDRGKSLLMSRSQNGVFSRLSISTLCKAGHKCTVLSRRCALSCARFRFSSCFETHLSLTYMYVHANKKH